jgi:hypothetical protein
MRESQMIDSARVSLPEISHSNQDTPSCNIQTMHSKSLPRQHNKQWLDQLTRSRTLVPHEYGICYRNSEEYNHLSFKKLSTSQDISRSSSTCVDDCDLTEPTPGVCYTQTSNTEARMFTDEDNYNDSIKEDYPNVFTSGTLKSCRLYNFVMCQTEEEQKKTLNEEI